MRNTLGCLFGMVFNRDQILDLARETGAVQRLREIHPADVVRSLVECALGDERRSIATARRHFGRIAGWIPEESAFYRRLNGGLATLMKRMFTTAVASCSQVKLEGLAEVLGGAGIVDLLALDGSQVTLPASAAKRLPSTDRKRGGVKLTAIMSILYQTVRKVTLTNARMHDRRALKLPRWLHGQLVLMDRGYCDRKLFATIADRRGFFLTRLKRSHRPMITKIRGGLAEKYIGNALHDKLPFDGEVDLDAEFRMPDGSKRTFRIVRLVIAAQRRGAVTEEVTLLFVTNLSPRQFTAEQMATLYRFRWQIEQLFKVLKTVGRLDHLQTANRDIIEAFLYATLLGLVLAMQVCAWMRRTRPHLEPSLHRVTALVLGYLPKIFASMAIESQPDVFHEFRQALWREGTNPNPGRPYTGTLYQSELRSQSFTLAPVTT